MIIINKAILHILDFNSNITVYSEQELNLQNQSILNFLIKHIERSFYDRGIKKGEFLENSNMRSQLNLLLNNEISFIAFSASIAETIHSAILQSDKQSSTDIIVCEFTDEDTQIIGILEYNNRVGFTHQVTNDNGVIRNEIINHFAILPTPSQKVDSYAFINMKNFQIDFCDKKSYVNGKDIFILPDIVLQCTSSISQKDTLKLVQTITRQVADNHGENSVATVSKTKNFIVENAEISDYIEPKELAKEVFSTSSIMQEEFIQEISKVGISDVVRVDRELAIKTAKLHKIKTDTGIEISFPSDYSQNKEYIEFINNPNGTLSIELKNINKITNK